MTLTIEAAIAHRHDLTTNRPIVSAGHWRIEREDSDPFVGQEYSLWHYGTRMIHWRQSTRYGIEFLSVSLGHGGVSDQQGMNRALRSLGAPHLYYSRKGGAHIVNQETGTVEYD